MMINNMISYETFKSNLINLLLTISDDLCSIVGNNNSIFLNLKQNIIPRLMNSFSYKEYYKLLKIAAEFRFTKLTRSFSKEESFQSFFVKKTIHDFKTIALYIEKEIHIVNNNVLLDNFYKDVEDWLMECVDQEIHIIGFNIPFVTLNGVPENEVSTAWFLILYLPLFKDITETHWLTHLNEIVNVGINENSTLILYPKTLNYVSPGPVNMIPTVLKEFYSILRNYHIYLESKHS